MRVGPWMAILIVLVMPLAIALSPGEFTNYCEQQYNGNVLNGCTLVQETTCTEAGFQANELQIVSAIVPNPLNRLMERSTSSPFCPTQAASPDACQDTSSATINAQRCCFADGVLIDADDYPTSNCCSPAQQADPNENTWWCGGQSSTPPPAASAPTFTRADCENDHLMIVEEYTVGSGATQQTFTHACVGGVYITEEAASPDYVPFEVPVNIRVPVVVT